MKVNLLLMYCLMASFTLQTSLWAAQAPGGPAVGAPSKEFLEIQQAIDTLQLPQAQVILKKKHIFDINRIMTASGMARGETILTFALKYATPDFIYTVINAGADVNVPSADGASPLIIASSKGKNKLVELLLDKGADATYKMPNGETALSLTRNPVIKKLLENKLQEIKGHAYATAIERSQKESEQARKALVQHIAEQGRGTSSIGEARHVSGIVEEYLMPYED